MKFKDVIQDLALGDLEGTPAVEVDSFEIQLKYLPKVIHSINRGLEFFYSRFVLKESQLLVKLVDGISHYYLDSKYALSNHSTDGIKYIIDNDLNPFNDDVIQILNVATLSGRELSIDDMYSGYGILLPEYNCIHVPMDIGEDYLSVVYQAGHKKIPLTEPATSSYEIELPKPMYSAFLAYVASTVLMNMGGTKVNEAALMYQKYEGLIRELINQGIGYKVQTGINIKPFIREWI